jgi:capsular exopolysaccharide synthesis family protein
MTRITHASAATQASHFSSAEQILDPWLIWVAFRQSWYWAVPLGAILASLGAYYVHRSFVPEYRASHILEANREYVVFQGILQAPVDLVQNERPLIYNQLVLGPVLSDPKICEAPSLTDPASREANLRRNMSVSDAGTRTLMQISYKDTDPVAAAKVCNAIVRSYLDQRQRFDDRRVTDLEGWLQPALSTWQGAVEETRKRIVSLSMQAKGFDPFQESSRINADTSYLNSLRDELSSLRSEEAVAAAELAMMKKEEESAKPSGLETDADLIAELVAKSPEVMSIAREIEEKETDMRNMERKDIARFDPRGWYDKLKKDTEVLKKQLAAAKERATPDVQAKVKSRMEKNLSSLKSTNVTAKENELSRIKTRRSVFESNYDAEEARLSKFAGETADLYFAQQKYIQASKILEKLEERVASIRTERQKSGTMQTLAEAVPPTNPEEIMPWKKVMMVAGGAFLIPFGLALLWELKTKRVTTATSLESTKMIPVLGEVARVPSGIKIGRKQRVYEESIETLRANMMFSTGTQQLRSIVVASSMSGEGKSSLASHLALSLTRATDQSVLLIDADLRSPDQHHLFGIEMGYGLSSVLSGKCSLKDAIDRSLGNHLHILPAGQLESNPHRLVSPEAVRNLLEQAMELYEYVIIDTAPVLAAGETLCLAAAADATLVCVMRDVSRHDNIKRCMNRLEAAGAKVIGTIFSGVSTFEYSYRYGDYRYTLPTMNS